MNPQRLAPNLREVGRLLNGARPRAIIEVAQTARREPDSGLVFGLKKSERAEPEGKECEQPPRAWCVQADQEHNEERSGAERDQPERAPSCLALRSDVRNAGDG